MATGSLFEAFASSLTLFSSKLSNTFATLALSSDLFGSSFLASEGINAWFTGFSICGVSTGCTTCSCSFPPRFDIICENLSFMPASVSANRASTSLFVASMLGCCGSKFLR